MTLVWRCHRNLAASKAANSFGIELSHSPPIQFHGLSRLTLPGPPSLSIASVLVPVGYSSQHSSLGEHSGPSMEDGLLFSRHGDTLGHHTRLNGSCSSGHLQWQPLHRLTATSRAVNMAYSPDAEEGLHCTHGILTSMHPGMHHASSRSHA